MSAFTDQRRAEYTGTYAAATLRPERAAAVIAMANRIKVNKEIYKSVAASTGVPWGVIGCLHARESDCDFKTHLHNGDSLRARTHHVPAGRPPFGSPPFTWDDSAADALRCDRIDAIAAPGEWTPADAAYAFEEFNGEGYRNRGVSSPYLWAGTTAYDSGKYVEDGLYNAGTVDTQPGAMAVLKYLLDLEPGALNAEPPAAPPLIPSEIKNLHKSRTVLGAIYVACGAAFSALKLALFPVFALVYDGVSSLLDLLPDMQQRVDNIKEPVYGMMRAAGMHAPEDFGLIIVGLGVLLVLYARTDAALQHKTG